MQTIQLPSPVDPDLSNVTRLWLAPGGERVGAILGQEVRYNEAGVCWDAAGRRSLWDVDLADRDDEYADPCFDRDLTRVVYETRGNWAWNTPGEVRARDLATGHEVVIGGARHYLPTLAADGRAVYAVAAPERGAPGLRRWALPEAIAKDAGELVPDTGWVIRQPSPRGDVRQLDVMLTSLGVSPDGGRIAGCRYNGKLTVWSARSRKELMTATAAKQSKYMRYQAHRPTFSPDGALLVALAARRKAGNVGFDVGVWSVKDGLKLKGPKEKESVNGVAFSPDATTLLTAREGGTVGVWDVTTWKLRREYAWKIGRLYSVAFAPDGLTCCAGGESGKVVVWDAE